MYAVPASAVQQCGAATLIVAIMLLLALTLATFSAARIGVSEQRSVANDIRAKQAFWVAQAGLEQGIAFINANHGIVSSGSRLITDPPRTEAGWALKDDGRWRPCNAGETAPPCGAGGQAHGNRWVRYDRLGAFAGVAFGIPLRWDSFPDYMSAAPEYTVAIDALARERTTGSPNTNYPIANTSLMVAATVTPVAPAVGGDVLRGMAPISVSQVLKGYDSMVARPIAPLLVRGTVNLSGASISIWANPGDPADPRVVSTVAFTAAANPDPLGSFNPPGPGGGPINPLSIWSRGLAINLGASSGTCEPQPQASMNSIPSPVTMPRLSGTPGCRGTPTGTTTPIDTTSATPLAGGDDRVACVQHPLDTNAPSPGCGPFASNTAPPAFPPDLFHYVFGVANTRFDQIRNNATILADCSAATLGEARSGLYWIDGACTIPANTNVGGSGGGIGAVNPVMPTAPITLVVNGSTLTLGAGVHVWGTVYLRGSTLVLPPVGGVAPVLHGALIADGDLTVPSGMLSLVYDTRAFTTSSARAGGFAKVLGGWRDDVQ